MDGASDCFTRARNRLDFLPPLLPWSSVYSLFCVQKLDGKKSNVASAAAAPVLFFLLSFFPTAYSPLAAQSSSGEVSVYQPQVLVNETLRYRMRSGRTLVGEMTVNIARDDIHGFIHIVESVTGLFERATALTLRHDAALRPLSSHTVFGKADRFYSVQLNYDDAAVSGQIDQPAEYGGKREIEAALVPATQDFFAVPYLLRARSLQTAEAISFPIFDFHQGRSARARAWVVRMETVSVPAGDFACHRVEGFSGKLRWIFLIEERFPHHLVKQVFPAMEIEMELIAVQETAGPTPNAAQNSTLKLQ